MIYTDNLPFASEQNDWRKVHDHNDVTCFFFGEAHNLSTSAGGSCFRSKAFSLNFLKYISYFIVHALTMFSDSEIKVINQSIKTYLQNAYENNLVFF